MNETEYTSAKPCGKKRSEIEKFAESFAAEHDFHPGDSLEALVAMLGGRIEYLGRVESWTADDGSLFVHGPGEFDIRLSAYTGPERDRFTIAHEIGHYVLHSRCGELRLRAARFGSTPVEWEANWFAASLLMPTGDFKHTCELYGNDAVMVASRYLVSPRAATVRMEALGIT